MPLLGSSGRLTGEFSEQGLCEKTADVGDWKGWRSVVAQRESLVDFWTEGGQELARERAATQAAEGAEGGTQ